jgi:hypothetical protein
MSASEHFGLDGLAAAPLAGWPSGSLTGEIRYDRNQQYAIAPIQAKLTSREESDHCCLL